MRIGALRTLQASVVGALLLALLLLVVLPSVPATAAEAAVSPLPASNYTVRHVCAAPAPGYAGCLALRLVPSTEAARARVAHPLGISHDAISPGVKSGVEVEKAGECTAAYGASCFSPRELQDAYFSGPSELPDAPASEPQTIALVDAYDDPNAEADLKVYDEDFDLPPCTSANKCFEQINQDGTAAPLPFPANSEEQRAKETTCKNKKATKKEREEACKEVEEAEGWALETSTDIEVAHAVCQNCRILLVETNSAEYFDLEAGEDTAVTLGATEISDSWGGETPPGGGAAFNHPGTVITAAAGDDGYLNWTEAEEAEKNHQTYYVGADYPSISPNVVAVGGTKLTLTASGTRQNETVWNEDPDPEGKNLGAGGGGCSTQFAAPEWQREVPDWTAVGCGSERSVADVSADADPYTGVAVYDSVPYPEEEKGKRVTKELGWVPIGGTSVASPVIASMFALAGGAHGVAYPAKSLYFHLGSPLLYDVTEGGNGECDDIYSSGCSGSLSSSFDCGEGALICNAAPGYDGPTGVGTPNGIAAFQPPAGEAGGSEGSSAGPSTTSAGGSAGAGASGSASTSQTGAASPSKAAGPSTATGKATIKLSAFALTPSALLSLRSLRPKASELGFAFTLSAPARVRATLAKLVRVHGHNRWVSVPGALTFAAAKGRNHHHLTSRDSLAPGRYRLTLTPQNGSARSIVFQVG